MTSRRVFLADFKIPRDDGAILLVEVQGGVWRRGKSAHTGTGQIRDGRENRARQSRRAIR